MCDFIITPILGALGAGTAGGAVAGAATAGGALQGIGTALSIGGSLFSGISAVSAASRQAEAIEQQKATEAALYATREERARMEFRRQIRRQAAELAARGINLASPTAVALGEEAAREMTFESQSIRQTGLARQQELTAEQDVLRARGIQGLLSGTVSAADTLLTAAPDLWPELLA